MIPSVGEKVLIIDRKLFAEDIQRHYVGEITRASENALKVKGHVWIRDQVKGFVRKTGNRERLVYPSDRTIINIIPENVNLNEIKYVHAGATTVVTDEKNFTLDVTEFAR
jgi:hypothetical protein